MSRQHAAQAVDASVEQSPRAFHGPDRPREFGVWLDSAHAADYLCCPSVHAFRMFVTRHNARDPQPNPIVARRRGRTLLFARRDLDRAIGDREAR